jgi:hypothetical protein
LYGEYYRGWRAQNQSDEDVLRSLEVNFEEAEELRRSVQNVWGFGAVQTIKPNGTSNFTTDLYLGYRKYELDVHLIGADAAAIPARRVKDFDVVMAGIRLRWGESDSDNGNGEVASRLRGR